MNVFEITVHYHHAPAKSKEGEEYVSPGADKYFVAAINDFVARGDTAKLFVNVHKGEHCTVDYCEIKHVCNLDLLKGRVPA